MSEWPKWLPEDWTSPGGRGDYVISKDLGLELYEALLATVPREYAKQSPATLKALARYEREVKDD